MKNLIELYTSFCASVGMPVDNQGFVSTLLPGSDTPKPFTIDSKRVVLPVPEQLQQADWSNRIGFHPLLQNVAGGESRVVEKFRDRMNGYADFMFGMLLVDIAQLAIKEGMHKELTPAQAVYLGPFSDADEKFFKLLTTLVATKRITKKNFEFVRFSVIKGRVYKGQKRSRVAVLHFPLYDALPKDGKGTVILGHKLRGDDVKMLKKMYEFMFPGINEEAYWEVASDSRIAPSMEALMSLYAKFIEVQNKAVSLLSPVINTETELLIVNDWRDDLENAAQYVEEIRRIPWLEGNVSAERVVAASAPQRINESPMAAAVQNTIAAPDQTPVLSVSAVQQIQSHQTQEVQQVQQQQQRPQIKMGVRAPTVQNASATHQISDAVANQVAGLSYARPGPNTPQGMSVGASYTEPAQQQQQFQQQQQPQFQQPRQAPIQPPAPPQAMKVPDTARIFNGQIYIPVEANGVAAIPQNAVIIENKVYVPITNTVGAPGLQQAASPFARQGQSVLPGNQFGMQQAITHPSQVPGLTPSEIQAFEANPVMFQNYLLTLQQAGTQVAQQAMIQRQNALPRYLQNAAERTQQQQQATQRGFFNR